MKIAFHGAAQTVTGSKHLVSLSDGRTILLDCGMFQGMGKETDPLNRHFGFDPQEVDVMVLSHAHIDHGGLIPKLVKEGFKGKIFCTPATRELAMVLLEDSAQIQEGDVQYINRRRKQEGKALIDPLYTKEDAMACADSFEELDYGQWTEIINGVELMFTDAGHIIGSACVHLRLPENGKTKQITFSGDVGRYRDVILRSPSEFPQSDCIILESTYGNSIHERNVTSFELLLEWIERTCIERKGKLIMPAFSVGRTQEILFALNQLDLENRLPPIPVFLDSPLSIKATELLKRYHSDFNRYLQKILKIDRDPFSFPGLTMTKDVEESKQLNYRNDPCIIISASGMAEAGRIKHHISNNIENSRNSILMTGYCEPNSLGGRLLAGNKEVSIFGTRHQVHAEIGVIKSMSAHGDFNDLSQWLACQDPKQVEKLFLVHGEYDVQQEFKDRLLKKGFLDVIIPAQHEEFGV